MKKILLLTLVTFIFSVVSFAQDRERSKRSSGESRKFNTERKEKTPEEMAKVITDRMDEKLKFNENQKKEVYAYNLKKATQRKVDMESRKKEMQSRRQAVSSERDELMKLLTPEQQQLLKQEFAERRKTEMKRRSPNRKNRHIERKSEGSQAEPIKNELTNV